MLEISVGRQLTQRRSLEEARENVEYLSNLPRVCAFTLHSIEIDDPVQQGLLWYYRGVIRYLEKSSERGDRIERDREIILRRVRRACSHKRWGRSCWHIEGEPPCAGTSNLVQTTIKKNSEYTDAVQPSLVETGQSTAWSPELPEEDRIQDIADKLGMASDPTRLKTILILAQDRRNVSELCSDLRSQSQPAVSHHLALLRHARLVEAQRDGKHNYYGLTEEGRDLADLVGNLAV